MAQYYEGIGRRKESIARVRLATGTGKFTVNEKEGPAFFTRMGDFEDILRPFGAVGQEATKYDVSVMLMAAASPDRLNLCASALPARSRSSMRNGLLLYAKRACSPAMPA